MTRATKNRAAGAVLALALATTAFVQVSTGPEPSLSRLLPSGALLVLESKDFGGALADWDSSAEKPAWLASDNFTAFAQSKLYLRLEEAREEFAAAAGVRPDMPLVRAIAGGESALAVYDIGELRMLYVTQLPAARAVETVLWRSRLSFEPREAGGEAYYVRSDADSGRETAFAAVGELLLLATGSDLMAGALELLAGQGDAVTSEGWYGDAVRYAGERGGLRLVHDTAALAGSPHFRSYWVQRNASSVRAYRAGAIDLDRASGAWTERRVLIPVEAPDANDDGDAGESGVGSLVRLIPDDTGYSAAALDPTASEAVGLLRQKLLGPAARGAFSPITFAPGAPRGPGPVGSEASLETRIDQPPLRVDSSVFDAAPLLALFSGSRLTGILRLESGSVSDVFVRSNLGLVVEAAEDWDIPATLEALTASAGGQWTLSGLGAGWTQAGEAYALDGLVGAAVLIRGRLLAVSNSADVITAIAARVDTEPVETDAIYSGRFALSSEKVHYRRLMGQLDAVYWGGYSDPDRAPYLLSENIPSLAEVLGRVESVSLQRFLRENYVEEVVTYELAP